MAATCKTCSDQEAARRRRHYEVERALADRLRRAPAEQRQALYAEVYEELARQLPEMPQLQQRADAAGQAQAVHLQRQILAPLLGPETVLLELGAGDCALALELSRELRLVLAVEASSAITTQVAAPPECRFELLRPDQVSDRVAAASVDVAYSCHFIEHLHPEDAADHLGLVFRLLRPGGVYICVTPNRLLGPHDISRYFDEVATGLHLCEYSYHELARLLRGTGFGRIEVLRGVGVPPVPWPVWPYRLIEGLLDQVPRRLRIPLLERLAPGRPEPFRLLEQVVLAAHRSRMSV